MESVMSSSIPQTFSSQPKTISQLLECLDATPNKPNESLKATLKDSAPSAMSNESTYSASRKSSYRLIRFVKSYDDRFLKKLMSERFKDDPRHQYGKNCYHKEESEIFHRKSSPQPVPPPEKRTRFALPDYQKRTSSSSDISNLGKYGNDKPADKPPSLLDLPPVDWPGSFVILGSALDGKPLPDNVFNHSAPKSYNLSKPNVSNIPIDPADPNFQSMVEKQIQMLNECTSEKNNPDYPNAYNDHPTTSGYYGYGNVSNYDYLNRNSYYPSRREFHDRKPYNNGGRRYGGFFNSIPYENHEHRRGGSKHSQSFNKSAPISKRHPQRGRYLNKSGHIPRGGHAVRSRGDDDTN
jgi:hypothetical protein